MNRVDVETSGEKLKT